MSHALRAFIKNPAEAKAQYIRYTGPPLDRTPGEVPISEPNPDNYGMHVAFEPDREMLEHELTNSMLLLRNRNALARDYSDGRLNPLRYAVVTELVENLRDEDIGDEVD